jgi:hypothetical protein
VRLVKEGKKKLQMVLPVILCVMMKERLSAAIDSFDWFEDWPSVRPCVLGRIHSVAFVRPLYRNPYQTLTND